MSILQHHRPPGWLVTFCALVLLFVLLLNNHPGAYTLEDNVRIEFTIQSSKGSISGRVAIPVWSSAFGFQAGGHLIINATSEPTNANILFMLLPLSQWVRIYSSNRDLKDGTLCTEPSEMRYQMRGGSISFDHTVRYTDQYIILVLKCEEEPAEVKVRTHVVALNPGDQHLSINDVPLISLFAGLAIVYAALLSGFSLYAVQKRRYAAKVHFMLALGVGVKLLEMVSYYLFYAALSRWGRLSDTLIISREAVSILNDTLFLAVLLMIAMGWTLTRDSVALREVKMFYAAFLLYILFRVFYAFCGEPTLCPAYVLSFNVIKFLITFRIIMAMNNSIEQLKSQSNYGSPDTQTEIFIKLQMFKTFRWSFLIYLVLPIALALLEFSVLSWKQDYILTLFSEVVVFSLYWTLCTTFRPRAYTLNGEPSTVAASASSSATDNNTNNNVNNDDGNHHAAAAAAGRDNTERQQTSSVANRSNAAAAAAHSNRIRDYDDADEHEDSMISWNNRTGRGGRRVLW